ncbi:MAG: energy-coupling factor transporter ATPase [Lachnospiraceae bacterium]|nr:energy-coupling factor transporter ATPase [Lachnospiraceae bacterium]
MDIVTARNLVFEYIRRDDDGNVEGIEKALDDVSLDIPEGSFVGILGANGSGKSTFAKHLNALLVPGDGTLWVDGMDTNDNDLLLKIRQTAGMVFQNPDNQIIATMVEEDVAFGPENMGVPREEMEERVEKSLSAVHMKDFREASPNRLSGGQKQRVAIAGVLAMEPKCIVLDEPTAMLDPIGRREVLSAVRELNEKKGITVILITHYMEEVTKADILFVMQKGKLVMQGPPREIFSRVEELERYGLTVPQVTALSYALRKGGIRLPEGILTREELVEELLKTGRLGLGMAPSVRKREAVNRKDAPFCINFQNVEYRYQPGTEMEVVALENVNLSIREGEFVAIIGHTGSGKSTLIQLMNGLNKPTSGEVYYQGVDISSKDYDRRTLRTKVGLVFQYPEYQLFESTVFKDVCFGPKNQGLDEKSAGRRAIAALQAVKFPEEHYYDSPFELSGGQKRRVAIAGVLAMEPEVLILDEPTAGLDPKGREEILSMVAELHEKKNQTVILVSHSMEDVARYAERLIVMMDGGILYDDVPGEVFKMADELEQHGLSAPEVTYVCRALSESSGLVLPELPTTVEEAAQAILERIRPC